MLSPCLPEMGTKATAAAMYPTCTLHLLYLLEPGLEVGRLGGVHLVDGHDQLLDAEGVGEQGVLLGLPVLGDTGLKLSSAWEWGAALRIE